jgi:hypothetical protein
MISKVLKKKTNAKQYDKAMNQFSDQVMKIELKFVDTKRPEEEL